MFDYLSYIYFINWNPSSILKCNETSLKIIKIRRQYFGLALINKGLALNLNFFIQFYRVKLKI